MDKEKHHNVVEGKKAKRKVKKERTLEQIKREFAIIKGNDYFDHVIYSLKCKIEEVEKNKENWKLAVRREPYPNGYIAPERTIIEQIEWNVNATQQINMHHDMGARAMIALVNAFGIEF